MLLRAAQCIGLHRDGTNFGISPLDCEIRRRLWHHILGSDARVAEDHGLSTSGFCGFPDTKLPCNVDDRDLDSSMNAAPVSKDRWTDMTLFLVAAETNECLQQVSQISCTVSSDDDKNTSLARLLATVKARINDRYLRHCDPNIPAQKAALFLGRVQMGKLEVLVRQQYLRGLSVEESAARASEQTLLLACEAIEIGNEMQTDELLSNFHWLVWTYTPYHLLTYALWHLCVRPGEHSADRVWEVVNESFSLVDDPNWPSPGLKWNALRKLREKALDIRCAFALTSRPRAALSFSDPASLSIEDGSVLHLGDGMLWDFDSICFPEFGPTDYTES